MIPDFIDRKELYTIAKRLITLSYSKDHFVKGIYLDNKLIEFINDVNITNDTIDLGYVINPIYQGHGYATEALKASIDFLFDNQFKKIITGAFIENTSSIRVMEKCGMKRLDIEKTIKYKGLNRKCFYFQIEK